MGQLAVLTTAKTVWLPSRPIRGNFGRGEGVNFAEIAGKVCYVEGQNERRW